MDLLAVGLNPVPIAGGSLVGEGLDGDRPRRLFATQGENDLVARLIDQPLAGCDAWPHRLAIDGQQHVARADVDAWAVEWRGRVRVPDVAAHHLPNAVAADVWRPLPVDAQVALPVVRALAVLAAHL